MKQEVFNPYLPSYEYIPDGEPYVFNGRVYVYGSHDRYNGIIFCMNDYVCYSAPLDDLSSWRYEGIIYKKNQDPKNKLGLRLLFAPDVVQGPDKRFYLYYALDFMGIMGVAVCDIPAGKYEFLGYVKYKNGVIWGRKEGDQFPFDPGVLVDDNKRIYLYSGFAKDIPTIATGFKKLKSDGGVVIELEEDMMTIKEEPRVIFPKEGRGSYKNHEFFEASSIRKIGNKYCFVYSSKHNHELCYAISNDPIKDFEFAGTLVSLGDLFLNGNTDEKGGVNYLGNTHGGLVNIKNKWYIFYHRHTNRHSYSRQACAESLEVSEDGYFKQAEVTSCGLNGGPLGGNGRYEARIACNLWSGEGVGRYDCRKSRKRFKYHPYLTQEGKDGNKNSYQYIANIRNGSTSGFKYFHIKSLKSIKVKIRGLAKGKIVVSTDKEFSDIICDISVNLHEKDIWITLEEKCRASDGIYPIYFKFLGTGYIDFKKFELKAIQG